MIAHHARMMHRGIFATLICDCCRSLISNIAELTGVKELWQGVGILLGWQHS
jgi:hypothetical protein